VGLETTLKRPIINTRDEPHADSEKYRRLHVIIGDANLAEISTYLKVGTTSLVLAMIEDRFITTDLTGTRPVRLAAGRSASALDIQREYYGKAVDFVAAHGQDASSKRVLELWGRALDAVERQDLTLIDREIDWATKFQLIERYRAKHDLSLSSPRIAQLDLAYHDISRTRGLYYLLQRKGAVERVVSDLAVFEAKSVPPQTTRAKLRGDLIKRAQERRRDFTVDWVHLKLNDQAQRTVLCKDPYRSVDERVEKLIASM